MNEQETESVYHGVDEPRLYPAANPSISAWCQCDPLRINVVNMTLDADMLAWRGNCEACGREHWAERGEAGIL